MAEHQHSFRAKGSKLFVPCRRGASCESMEVHYEGVVEKKRFKLTMKPYPDPSLVCEFCHLCFWDAPDECKSRDWKPAVEEAVQEVTSDVA